MGNSNSQSDLVEKIEDLRFKNVQAVKSQNTNRLLQFEIALWIALEVDFIGKYLSGGFNSESYNELIHTIFKDSDEELNEEGIHYKRWQYIMHFTKCTDRRVAEFRAMFDDDQFKRQSIHEFCLSMELAGQLVSPRFHKNFLLLRKQNLNQYVIMDNLRNLGDLERNEIADIIKFLNINSCNFTVEPMFL